MADGSGRPASIKAAGEATAEAAAAATEAAREAHAEALERSEISAPETRAIDKKTARASTATADDLWHRFVVDVWLTNFNSIEFGFWKKERNKGKSRQFTSDMDVFAEVIENGERTGLLAYREDLWKKNVGMDKRLVFKLFGEKLNWHATMDLMVARSLQLTLGAHGLPVTAFSINAGDDKQMVYLERSAHKWPLLPENFSFFTMDDREPRFYRLRRDLIDVGGDYTLYDQNDKIIGTLDGKIFSLGGKWNGRLLKSAMDKRLLMILKLFCGMIIFNGPCRRHIRTLAADVKTGRYLPRIERQEADLYMNPRRTR